MRRALSGVHTTGNRVQGKGICHEENNMNCPKCGGEMWDNRANKKNPKQPDFKCKDRENCDGVIWPPRGKSATLSQPAPQTQATGRTGSAPAPFGRSPETQARIERQHSQEMALRYFAIRGTELTSDMRPLRLIIDWFQRDIGHTPAEPEKSQEPEEVPTYEIPF